jgi:glyoxylase-like metal-dependent hydrolase (beta-lactamase superfamily II)
MRSPGGHGGETATLSPGGIALFGHRDGTLFSGDVVYDDVLLDTITGSDQELYRARLRRLRELPIRVARPGPGHASVRGGCTR